ncbi:MAG TPA: hypothetical protein VL357_03000 [Rariglobus sp.]|jgi:hypothetical protein|nr:hypothetical protein [Rariglobus sp.]
MPSIWTINGTPIEQLGLGSPRLTFASLQPDTFVVDHLAAPSWDAAPIFTYGETLIVRRAGVIVFVGKVLKTQRFLGAQAETISYQAYGPWDWLERRPLRQNSAVIVDPLVSTVPIYVPTGFIILNQADDGAAVEVGASLAIVINAAIDAGVPIALGVIEGFDYNLTWEEISDLQIADAIVKLLATAPDAVVSWAYATGTPTINIRRRTALPAITLTIAPKGTPPSAYGPTGYAEFESIHLLDRPDLVIPGVFLTFRRTNTVNGNTYLSLEKKIAGNAAVTAAVAAVATAKAALAPALATLTAASIAWGENPTDPGLTAAYNAAKAAVATARAAVVAADAAVELLARSENALCRTIQLAGVNFSETVPAEKITVLPLFGVLGDGELDDTVITTGSDFDELKKFWLRKVPDLAKPGVVITGFKNRQRLAAATTSVADGITTEVTPALDTSLVNELIEGTITPWMEKTGLNRQGQKQIYSARIAYTIGGVAALGSDGLPGVEYTADVMATNCTSRVYSYQESADSVPEEPTPPGMETKLYAALSVVQYEGDFTLVQQEATLSVLPGMVVNLGGGMAAWATMKALVQSVSVDIATGTTQVQVGWPSAITPDDLTSINRANRLKAPAYRGLNRASGVI